MINWMIKSSFSFVINKSTTDISFLSELNLRERIEFVISLNLDFDNLDVLNYFLTECYKLKIANILDIPLYMVDINEEDLLIDFSKEIIPKYCIDMLNSDDYIHLTLPNFLEDYRIDSRTLSFNSVMVSSEKVKRNLSKFGKIDKETCFYAIIYNVYYTYDEIENIRLCLLENKDMYTLIRKLN